MKKILLLMLLCGMPGGLVNAAENAPVKGTAKTVKADTGKITYRRISEATLQKLRSEKEFIYKEKPPEQLSLWDRFWMWVWRQINRAMAYGATNPVLRYLFIALMAGVIGYVIYRLVRADKLFLGSSTKNQLDYDIYPDNIHHINYEQELAALIGEGKYRLAIRLLYLRSLKELSDKGSIAWQPDKTNYIYVNEVTKEDLKQIFKNLTLKFDYIWYGHFPVDEEAFRPLQQSFDEFNAMIR